MDLNERAKNYAADKALEAITKAIEQAYKDGYQDGYDDGNREAPVVNDDCEYVDLGLPSGTRWARGFMKEDNKELYLPYGEACNLNIPTKEQFEELQSQCKIEVRMPVVSGGPKLFADIIGPNGKRIALTGKGMKKSYFVEHEREEIMFWIKSAEIFEGNERPRFFVSKDTTVLDTTFSGYMLPILLVR